MTPSRGHINDEPNRNGQGEERVSETVRGRKRVGLNGLGNFNPTHIHILQSKLKHKTFENPYQIHSKSLLSSSSFPKRPLLNHRRRSLSTLTPKASGVHQLHEVLSNTDLELLQGSVYSNDRLKNMCK
ncbi:hypothetical protein QJS10_CPA03g00683 [Acorus calamus]|uniref:Uncharacterized protein n=1 Tax=Acorus calamus TaxID=4465 RepID=A0AAV9F4J8_ACOCL|nr:hypothetical protein QJS10_CPA03g00683 [Acorus calamus]